MANLHLFWDGATAPTGWTIVSNSGGAFYQKMIRGNSTYGVTGGTLTHTHTVSGSSSSPSTYVTAPSGSNPAKPNHYHPISGTSITSTPPSNLPNYRTLKVIKYNTVGNPTSIPTGAIAIFSSSTMTGYTRYSTHDNYHMYCDGTTGIIGGTNTHNHTVSGGSADNPAAGYRGCYGGSAVYSCYGHTHTFLPSTSDTQNHEPPYLTTFLGKKNSPDNAPTPGIIGMWDASPSLDWTILSNSDGDFYQKFIKPSNSYNSTGGNQTHAHTSAATTGVNTVPLGFVSGSGYSIAADGHTHTVTISLAGIDHTPPYIDVIFARYDGYGSLHISSTPEINASIYIDSVLQTGITTPITISSIPARTHTYQLTKTGYTSSTVTQFTITVGSTTTISQAMLTAANVTATNMTVTPSEKPCRTTICTITVVVRWSNNGGTDGTVIPNLIIDSVPQTPHDQRTVIAGSYIDDTFTISGLSVGPHTICPLPN